MVRRLSISLVVLLFGASGTTYGQLVPNLGGQRVGISAFQSLKIGVGPRAVGMGESFVAVANDASALYWNPAGLVLFGEHQVFISRTEYVVDIKHDFLGIVYHLGPEDALGGSVSSLHMDDMEITTETQPFGTGRYFSFGDIAVGLTYAKRMTDQFSFGATVRYVRETLDVLSMSSFMVDLGTYYKTGLGSTRFAVVITNFGADATPTGVVVHPGGRRDTAFQSFSLPTMFKLGIALEAFQTESQRLTASVQLNHLNDNAEHVRVGLEYAYNEQFFVRGGIKRTIGQKLLGADETTEEDLSFGAGFLIPTSLSTFGLQYSFSTFHRLGDVHRISLEFTL